MKYPKAKKMDKASSNPMIPGGTRKEPKNMKSGSYKGTPKGKKQDPMDVPYKTNPDTSYSKAGANVTESDYNARDGKVRRP